MTRKEKQRIIAIIFAECCVGCYKECDDLCKSYRIKKMIEGMKT